jgi:hypothetical protein
MIGFLKHLYMDFDSPVREALDESDSALQR